MTAVIQPGKIAGEISAIPSKSHLHRQLIFAALADKKTQIICAKTEAEDIHATANCLRALGAEITRNEEGFLVTPTKKIFSNDEKFFFPVCESGSTLRFLLPIVCALGINGAFEMKGRLPNRPLAPLDAQLEKHEMKLSREKNILNVEGLLESGNFILPGDVSSQYVSGLLMALPLLDSPSKITVTPPIESADYIEMTLDVAREFSCEITRNVNINNEIEYEIFPRAFASPGQVETEGDWSNGAFWLCAGAMPGGEILLRGLRKNSKQGDRFICDILRDAGAEIFFASANFAENENNFSQDEKNFTKENNFSHDENNFTNENSFSRDEKNFANENNFSHVEKNFANENNFSHDEKNFTYENNFSHDEKNFTYEKNFSHNENIFSRENKRKFSEVDARAIPDLIPVLAAVASVGEGTTIFKNAARLRLKESDRLKATAETLSILGANIRATDDGLIVKGVPILRGGEVDSFGDHRIAMMAAIASAACENPVTIRGAHAVNKSYPDFWNDLRKLGKTVDF
ncbi:MAG: 3-phosphoshikimate 1-carboxyvinyltransferase [Defluviitaleaceae bacterium]|nr:3-phosphoshikimate 1-carboxyvinyltransferase [Defluviitaleaceae bacterium]